MVRAVFLDRDGVLVDDVDVLTRACDIRVCKTVPAALWRLKRAGYRLVVVSNQAAVARGLLTEVEAETLMHEVGRRLVVAGGPELDGAYFCPHHPNATVVRYRLECECRKPRPGLLLQAAERHQLDVGRSYMVGDRISDVAAGSRAGCRTILVTTGAHQAAPIESPDSSNWQAVQADYVCANLGEAAEWILQAG